MPLHDGRPIFPQRTAMTWEAEPPQPPATAAVRRTDPSRGPGYDARLSQHDGMNWPMPYPTPDIRNVALAGHPGAGKTTLVEALLHAGGAIQAAGTVERGNTVSDFDPMERQRGHSIDAAIAGLDHAPASGRSVHVNLIGRAHV